MLSATSRLPARSAAARSCRDRVPPQSEAVLRLRVVLLGSTLAQELPLLLCLPSTLGMACCPSRSSRPGVGAVRPRALRRRSAAPHRSSTHSATPRSTAARRASQACSQSLTMVRDRPLSPARPATADPRLAATARPALASAKPGRRRRRLRPPPRPRTLCARTDGPPRHEDGPRHRPRHPRLPRRPRRSLPPSHARPFRPHDRPQAQLDHRSVRGRAHLLAGGGKSAEPGLDLGEHRRVSSPPPPPRPAPRSTS